VIGFILTGLSDLGFAAGHAARTVADCRALAGADPVVLISLLEATSSGSSALSLQPELALGKIGLTASERWR
jgi:UTP:GlnB (protein PII) uridylyltransferase